jgi:hypothetical protein
MPNKQEESEEENELFSSSQKTLRNLKALKK